jgi:hypothetical protein
MIRQMHSRHLTFLKEGLLIADTSTAVLVRDILDVCRRFTSTVERWGGDVIPELLMEGASGEQTGQMVQERDLVVRETNETLHELLADFFKMLVDAQNPTADKDGTFGGTSFSRTSRATQILQIQNSRVIGRQTSFAGVSGRKGLSKEISDRALDVEASMSRHLEQCGSCVPDLVVVILTMTQCFFAWTLMASLQLGRRKRTSLDIMKKPCYVKRASDLSSGKKRRRSFAKPVYKVCIIINIETQSVP